MRTYEIENLHEVDHVAFDDLAKAEIRDYACEVARQGGYMEVGDVFYFSTACVDSSPIFDLSVVGLDDDRVVFRVIWTEG